jgi:hypothetical protein
MLMHAVFSASMLILQPLGIALVPGLNWNLVLAAALWIFIGALAVAQGGHLSQQPLRKRVAQERSSPYSLAARKHAKRDIATSDGSTPLSRY